MSNIQPLVLTEGNTSGVYATKNTRKNNPTKPVTEKNTRHNVTRRNKPNNRRTATTATVNKPKIATPVANNTQKHKKTLASLIKAPVLVQSNIKHLDNPTNIRRSITQQANMMSVLSNVPMQPLPVKKPTLTRINGRRRLNI